MMFPSSAYPWYISNEWIGVDTISDNSLQKIYTIALKIVFLGNFREPSGRNLRHMLASVILRLLGNRVVHEDVELSYNPIQTSLSKREVESSTEAASSVITDLSGVSLFDRLLLVLHGLLSSCQPSWLRSKPASKSSNDYVKEVSVFDRELAETLQVRYFLSIIEICCFWFQCINLYGDTPRKEG